MVIIFVFIAIFHFLSRFVFLSMKMHIRKYLIFKEQGLFPISNFEMLHIFIGCSSLHQPLALLSEVAVSTITIASGVSKSVSAVTAIAVVGIGVRRTLAVSVAKTAVTVSGVKRIAVESVNLRVSSPLAITAISVAKTAIAIAKTAIAVSGVSATVAVISVGLRVGGPLAIAAISVAQTTVTIAQTAIAVSGVSTAVAVVGSTIAVVSVSLRVSIPLD